MNVNLIDSTSKCVSKNILAFLLTILHVKRGILIEFCLSPYSCSNFFKLEASTTFLTTNPKLARELKKCPCSKNSIFHQSSKMYCMISERFHSFLSSNSQMRRVRSHLLRVLSRHLNRIITRILFF